MIQKIKRLLILSEKAQAKVEFNHNGTKVINPMQQAAASRLYNRAYKLKAEMSSPDFIKIHREVIESLNNEKTN
jgi:hypothetical protein